MRFNPIIKWHFPSYNFRMFLFTLFIFHDKFLCNINFMVQFFIGSRFMNQEEFEPLMVLISYLHICFHMCYEVSTSVLPVYSWTEAIQEYFSPTSPGFITQIGRICTDNNFSLFSAELQYKIVCLPGESTFSKINIPDITIFFRIAVNPDITIFDQLFFSLVKAEKCTFLPSF